MMADEFTSMVQDMGTFAGAAAGSEYQLKESLMSPTTMVFQERLGNPIASGQVCPVSAIIFQAPSEQSLHVCVWVFSEICPVPVSGSVWSFAVCDMVHTYNMPCNTRSHPRLGTPGVCGRLVCGRLHVVAIQFVVRYFFPSVSVCVSVVLPSGSYLQQQLFFPFFFLSFWRVVTVTIRYYMVLLPRRWCPSSNIFFFIQARTFLQKAAWYVATNPRLYSEILGLAIGLI